MSLGQIFPGCLENYSICVFFLTLGLSPSSPAGAPPISKQLVPFQREAEATLLWAQLGQHLSFCGVANPSRLLMPQPNSASLRHRASVGKGHPSGAQHLCVSGMSFSSFSQRRSSICQQTAWHDSGLLISLLHAVVFKCQIVIRAEGSDQVRPLVTV